MDRRALCILSGAVVPLFTGSITALTAFILMRHALHHGAAPGRTEIIAIVLGGLLALGVSWNVPSDVETYAARQRQRHFEGMGVFDLLSKQSAAYLLAPAGLAVPYPFLCLVSDGLAPGVADALLAASSLVGGGVGFFAARFALSRSREVFERGTEVLRKEESVEGAIRRHADYLRKIRDPGIQLGPSRIESEAAKGHVLILGATRTGKSLISWSLIRSVLENFRPGEDKRAVIFDAKQDTLSKLSGLKLRCRIVTLNPFDERCHAWRIAADIRTPAAAQRLAGLLVPRNPRLAQQHWDETLRGLIEELVIAFVSDENRRDVWTFRDLIYAATSHRRAVAILSETPTGRDLIEMSLTDPEHALNVMATVSAKLRPFRIIAALWDAAERQGRRISIDEWKGEQTILVLGNSHELREAMRTVNQVLVSALSQAMLDSENDEARQNWVFLDEVRQAGKLAYLTDLMVEGASKGVKVVMCFQDDKGLDEEYGKNLSGELSGQCHTIVVTKLNQEETAEHAARKFGEVEAWERRSSTTSGGGSTTSWELVRRPAVLPSEIMRLQTPSRQKGVGVTAFYLSPIGAYRYTMTPEFLDLQSWARNEKVPDFVKRPPADQYLRPWDEVDIARLRLPASILAVEREPQELERKPRLKLLTKSQTGRKAGAK